MRNMAVYGFLVAVALLLVQCDRDRDRKAYTAMFRMIFTSTTTCFDKPTP